MPNKKAKERKMERKNKNLQIKKRKRENSKFKRVKRVKPDGFVYYEMIERSKL